MTVQQIAIIKNSWKILQQVDPVLLGDVFYRKLFITAPRLQSMFRLSTEDQSKKLVNMLNMIVGRLDRIDEISEDIRLLALRHVSYGVRPGHYAVVGSALLWTLEQGLGLDWNEKVKQAWVACYELISATMMNAVTRAGP